MGRELSKLRSVVYVVDKYFVYKGKQDTILFFNDSNCLLNSNYSVNGAEDEARW